MQQREEKQLDLFIDSIILRVNDLKNAIAQMIMKLERESESMNWPSFLDNYALISGQMVSLSKMLGHDKHPMRSLAFLPLNLNPDKDEHLMRLSEGRVPTFAHDLVPNYLRTKPDPEIEQKIIQLDHKATSLAYDTIQKQIATYNKVVGNIWELISKAREEWETEGNARAGQNITTSMPDTHALVAAVAMGKGLKVVPNSMPPNMMGSPGRPPGSGAQLPPSQLQQQLGPMGKVPSAIKTNIKAANQMHPYGR